MPKILLTATALALLSLLAMGGLASAQYFQVPTPYPQPYPSLGYGGSMPSVVYGQRCQFMAGICVMGAPGPVGSPCYCMTPYGAAAGTIVP
jgi:hypothetical protein